MKKLFTLILVLLAATCAVAQTTAYTLLGATYLGVGGYASATAVTGKFYTASPLAANLSNVAIASGTGGTNQVTSFSFSDGPYTYTQANSSVSGGDGSYFSVSTDGSGAITNFQIKLTQPVPGVVASQSNFVSLTPSVIAAGYGNCSVVTNSSCTNWTSYAADSAFNGSSSASFSAASVPGTPAAPTAVGAAGQATVTFVAPAANGSPITGYTVTSIPAGGVDSNAGTTALTHTIIGLTNGTAYTFTVTATNAVGTGNASPASNSVTPVSAPGQPFAPTATPGYLEATVTFMAPPSNGGAITGYTVTSNPAGGVDSGAGTTSLTRTITGLSNNTSYTFSVTATNAYGTSAASAASNAVTPSAIPPQAISIPGITSLPSIVNLRIGDGPAFSGNLVTQLSNTLGQQLQFVEQNSTGNVTLNGYNGGYLSYMAHTFKSSDNRANGIYPDGTGQYVVVNNGQSVVLAPSVVHLDQLAGLVGGVNAKINDSGVITANLNSAYYVLRPSAFVAREAASGTARLVVGADGFYHFIDAQGNNQILYPAFAEPDNLRSVLQGMDTRATIDIQLDSTASVVVGGVTYTLVPDAILNYFTGASWWQESATRYRLNVQSHPGTSQGLTLR